MPKQSLKISSFHSGLNSKADPRDIKDDELADVTNAYVDSYGKITLSGDDSEIVKTGLDLTSLADGYGLFRFSSDYAADASSSRTDYIIVWDDTTSKFYWLPSGASAWDTPTWLDVSASWATGETSIPIYYFVDGALRISDGQLSNDNEGKWIGVVDRTLFPDNRSSSSKKLVISPVWKQEPQELVRPANGTISLNAPAAEANINAGGIYWRIRNLRESTDQLCDFSDTTSNPGSEEMYDMNEPYGQQSNDESWQTARPITDGYGDSAAHAFGFGFYDENDDANNNWDWKTLYAGNFNTSNSKSFGTGQSLYLAVRMTGEEQKQMWLGTHYRPESGDAFLSMSVDDGTISFINANQSETIKYHLDITDFTDSTTKSGEWHILEFPFDEPFESNVSGTIDISKIHLELSVSWTRKGSVSTKGSSRSATYSGEDFIQLSDLRVGESGLQGVDTVGKQKFSMSFTYDDKENESLLYDFGGANEVVLANSTSSYKIGIDAYIKQPTNYRVTGANLYIDDEGVPYRIAECRYTKGLRGSWESEFPTDLQFDEAFSSDSWKSSLIKTDGLPLLESYEAMNGFSPKLSTISSSYKTAAVQNRQVYIGNVKQDGKERGDRMIKTSTNSFDVFPDEGREIDIVINDGDDIIKLESYADRILQFKRNVMYLINATRNAEYLEDTFFGKGISNSGAVTKTDMGIAWANTNGCFFYDGEKVHNLSESLINDDDWSTHINNSTDVTYSPIKKKILVGGGTNNVDIYEFSFVTKSWVYSTSKLVGTEKTNFIVDVDEDIKWVEQTKLKKWDSSPASTSSLKILTRDFDFGNPATRKKCFKFYITYKADADTNVEVRYGTNGVDLTGSATGTEVSVDGTFAGTSTSCYTADDGLLSTGGEWKQAELKPSTSTNNIYSVQVLFLSTGAVPSSFEINDITIVYRPKPLK